MDHSEVKHLPKVDHTPAELDEPSKVILRAAAAIETYGHTQGDIGDVTRGFCITGALQYVNEGRTSNWPVGTVSKLDKGFGGCWLPFNNAPGRTKDEVVARLRSIALSL